VTGSLPHRSATVGDHVPMKLPPIAHVTALAARPTPDNAAVPSPLVPAFTAAAPIADFPGIEQGDEFEIVRGSTAGPIGVRGTATVDLLEPEHMTFHVVAGRFGMNVDVVVDIVRVDDQHVEISSRGEGIPDTTDLARIVEQRTNFIRFEQASNPTNVTSISHDGNGNLVVDAVIPNFGAAHLLLDRR